MGMLGGSVKLSYNKQLSVRMKKQVWERVRNFAYKLSILTARLTGEIKPDPVPYLDLSCAQALDKYKNLLSESAKGIILFGFSDEALLAILDEEFEVDMETHGLLFRKTFLDARSIRLAGIGRNQNENHYFTEKEQALIDKLALWLLDATRELYRPDLSEARLEDIRREYVENVRTYALKYAQEDEAGGAELLLRSLFASSKIMNAFCHSLTVDAMFKADAVKVIFGEQSGYYQAWFRKQIFRHMMSKAVEQYITSCVAQ
jgi:hypothetical protein